MYFQILWLTREGSFLSTTQMGNNLFPDAQKIPSQVLNNALSIKKQLKTMMSATSIRLPES